jgi:hypothetical protein
MWIKAHYVVRQSHVLLAALPRREESTSIRRAPRRAGCKRAPGVGITRPMEARGGAWRRVMLKPIHCVAAVDTTSKTTAWPLPLELFKPGPVCT